MHIKEALRSDLATLAPLLATPEGRRVLTEHDPLLFAWLYFPEHLADQVTGEMTLCEFHEDLIEWAKTWTQKPTQPKANRACFIAPRQSGKTTWIFLLLPMWAAAHGHRKFVAAFSDTADQAMNHLQTFKMELHTNDRLRQDFPELCEGKKLSNSAKDMQNNRNQITQANDFKFWVRGADSSALGMKTGALRPDVLLFDDIEPGESNYSDYEAKKRKETLQSDLFALNPWAVLAIVGTTTMPNSLIDQIRKVDTHQSEYEGPAELFREDLDPDFRWVVDENIKVHYWPAIISEGDTERSLWPERWPIELLDADRHTRAFQKNMMNRPLNTDGGYWNEDDIDIDRPVSYTRTLISVDPAVTTARRSDYTGVAVVSTGSDGLIYVRYANQFKLDSDTLADKVSELIKEYDATICVVETNQGGDLWKQVFKDIPCRYKSIRAKEKKEVRAAKAVDFYKRGQVKHTHHFAIAEEQMLAFPKVTHDDVVDAVVTGVLAFKKARRGISAAQHKYMKEAS